MSGPSLARGYRLSSEAKLAAFAAASLERTGVAPADAGTVAEVVVAADLRGIEAHGIARFARDYAGPVREGAIAAAPRVAIETETATTIVLDAANGLGPPVAARAMRAAIEKATAAGVGFAAVKNSNTFGIGAFYAMLALERDMIGIAATTAGRSAAPTFGMEAMLGSNPWAYAIPALDEPPFVLDFATTTVQSSDLRAAARDGRTLPPGWALDSRGLETRDPGEALEGVLLPLGGVGTDNGGHKGYGLGLLVEIMCAVLAGGAFGRTTSTSDATGQIAHFFGAIKIEGFRDVTAFKRDVDRELRAFKDSPPAPGFDRVRTAGEREYETALARRRDGIPIHESVWSELERLATELGLAFDLAR